MSQTQAAQGFKRLNDALPDLTCDTPNASELLAAFELAAKRDGVLPADA